jgi:hypothetical protein
MLTRSTNVPPALTMIKRETHIFNHRHSRNVLPNLASSANATPESFAFAGDAASVDWPGRWPLLRYPSQLDGSLPAANHAIKAIPAALEDHANSCRMHSFMDEAV